jgi:hypothetical protein
MKNQLKFAFGILLLFGILFSNVSSYSYYDNSEIRNNERVVVITRDSGSYNLNEWENEDRYPLYDYRWGYSYRTSDKYQEEKIVRNYRSEYNLDYINNNYYSDRYYQEKPSIKYVYNDYMRNYDEIECFQYPPKDRFFYIKC